MELQFYVDENYPGPVTNGLRQAGIDVLTVQEDGRTGEVDEKVLRRAWELRRVLLTNDADFLEIADRWREGQLEFFGVIFGPRQRVDKAHVIRDVRTIATRSSETMINEIVFLPLRSGPE